MEFYNEHYIKVSRKAHLCHICDSTIAEGEGYHREDGKFGGDFFDRCTCNACYAVRDDYMDRHGENEYEPDNIGDFVVDVFCGQHCEESGACTMPQPLLCQRVRDYYELRTGDKHG